jgi:hypothetical protein
MERGIKFRSIAFCPKSDIKNLVKTAPVNVSKEPIIEKQEPSQNVVIENQNVVQTVSVPISKSKSPAKVQPIIEQEEKDSGVIANNEVSSIPLQSDFANSKELLNYILTINDARKLGKLFDEQKHKGMLIFGGKTSISFPDKCYIVFYSRDGVVTAYLDKGSSMRKNLITGEMESMNLYKDNPYIWFQLMN